MEEKKGKLQLERKKERERGILKVVRGKSLNLMKDVSEKILFLMKDVLT